MIGLLALQYTKAEPTRAALDVFVMALAYVFVAGILIYRAQVGTTQHRETSNNVLVFAKSSLLDQLPISLAEQLNEVPGVRSVAWIVRFGAMLDEGKVRVPSFAVSDNYLEQQSHLEIASSTLQRWRDCRNCAIVGSNLMQQQGWRIGQTVSVQSNSWRQRSGEVLWAVQVAGFYRSLSDDVPAATIYVHYDYLNDSRTRGEDTAGAFLAIADDATDAASLPSAIDQSTANTANATWSFPENGVNAQLAKQVAGLTSLLTFTVMVLFLSVLTIVCNGFFWFLEQRRTDISALHSAGMSRRQIITIFSCRNFALALGSLTLAILTGWVLEGTLSEDWTVNLSWIVPLLLFGLASGLTIATIPVALALLGRRDLTARRDP